MDNKHVRDEAAAKYRHRVMHAMSGFVGIHFPADELREMAKPIIVHLLKTLASVEKSGDGRFAAAPDWEARLDALLDDPSNG